MKRIARFEKVSFEQFVEGWGDTLGITDHDKIRALYDGIRLPRRATAGSAGYDFFAPADITLRPGETIKIPTGVRVWMEPEWVLKCYPRSGLGFNVNIKAGEGFMQGIFVEYGITLDDDATEVRNGGFGSTTK